MKPQGVLILMLFIFIGAFLVYATCKIAELVQMSRKQLRNIKTQIQLVDSKITNTYNRLTTTKLEIEDFLQKQQENKKMKIMQMQ